MRIPTHPLIYEINTWPWLTALSREYNRPISLASIPTEVYDALAAWGFDAIWLMGVWERSPAALALAQRPQTLAEYRSVLPDLTPADVVGSAYAIHRYVVDDALGGPEGLVHCRAALSQRGMGLLLDYVPNHVATDHPWLTEHPDALVHGDANALAADPVTFFAGPTGEAVAHGRDPYFPAWIDTAQINGFSPTARELTRSTLDDIANQCDGVRCDMAMLLLNRVFASTWGAFAGQAPGPEFWADIIPAIKAPHPDFLFLAEAYWGTEPELLALGFDYTYDKDLYDWLRGGQMEAVRQALRRLPEVLSRQVHFVENHDETRAVEAFGAQRSLAAATISLLIPGASLLHDGQLAGWHVKTPVQLGRRLEEATDLLIEPFYRTLLNEASQTIYRDGRFMPLDGTDADVLAFLWALGDDWRLIVVNYTAHPARIPLSLPIGLFQAPLLSAQEVFSGASATLGAGKEGRAGIPFDLDLPAYGVQLWRPR